MRKMLATVLAVVLCFGALGMTIAAADSTDPIKIVIWGGVPEDKGPQKVCENFNATHPGIQAEYIRYVNDDQGNVKLDTALISGEKIDIFISYGYDKLAKRVEAGMAAELSGLCEQYDVDVIRDFGEAAKNSVTADSKVYAIPTYKQVMFIMLNKNMLDAAGVEIPQHWTWSDVRETAKLLTTGENAGKVYGFLKSTDGNVINEIVSTEANRDCWLNADATATNFVDNPYLRQGYQILYDMMYTDQSMMSWEDMIVQKVSANEAPMFFNQQVAMVATGSHQLRNIKDTTAFPRDFVVAFAEMPALNADQAEYYADLIVQDHLSINEKSDNKEAAMEYIKWYYTEGYDPMIEGGRMPLYQYYDADKAIEIMLQGAEALVDMESAKNVLFGSYDKMQYDGSNLHKAEIALIMKEEMEAFFLKQIDLDKALENMQNRCDEVLKY
ncbi:MAG: extracellular solute-binding protein [Clostridiales bacterium]|nr:extracellular solute-binding protein [Clostridiales bacterium]